MTDLAKMRGGRLASSQLFDIVETLEGYELADQPMSADLLSGLRAELQLLTEHVMGLEAMVRSVEMLGPAEYMQAVRALPETERKAIARAALQSAEGGTVLRFPKGGRRS